jgi:regulator of sigma E protease
MFSIVSVVIALALLSVLVVIHEFGHFVVAKKTGVWVEEFGIGLPPRVWGKKIGETIYSINALPLGGFVRLHGETEEGRLEKPKRSFVRKSAKVRVLITLAGVTMNVIFAFLAFSIFYSFQGVQRERDLGEVHIVSVLDNSPAKKAGFNEGDVVKSVDGKKTVDSGEFIALIESKKGKVVRIDVERRVDNERKIVPIWVTPNVVRDEKGMEHSRIGVEITSKELYFYYPPWWQRPIVGITEGAKFSFTLTKEIFIGLGRVFISLTRGDLPNDVAGPVVVVALTSEITKLGVLPSINLAGAISLNLAVFNLIPFPPLDGSRILFIVIEKLRRGKRISSSLESKIYTAGFVLLIIFVIFLSFREVPRLIEVGSFSKFADGLLK